MITADMYPITIETLHSGCIRGRECIITLHSGVYGWAGDGRLHVVLLYDGRGHPTPSNFLSAAENECSEKHEHRFQNAHFAPSFTVETEHSNSATAAWQMTQVLDSKRGRDY